MPSLVSWSILNMYPKQSAYLFKIIYKLKKETRLIVKNHQKHFEIFYFKFSKSRDAFRSDAEAVP